MEDPQHSYQEPSTLVWIQQDLSTFCRVCANSNDYLIPIFKGEGLENHLKIKIEQHLPIKICENDGLPNRICYQCASTLLAWHELFENCLTAEKRLNSLLEQHSSRLQESLKPDNENDTSFLDEQLGMITDGEDIDENVAPSASSNNDFQDTCSENIEKLKQPMKKRLRVSQTKNEEICDELSREEVLPENRCLMFKEYLLVSRLSTNAKYCSLCGEKFQNLSFLSKHMNNAHQSKLPMNSKVKLTVKKLSSQILPLHFKKNGKKETTFPCVCGVGFLKRIDLLKHQREKHPQLRKKGKNAFKSIQCCLCKKVFHVTAQLKNHVKLEHKGKILSSSEDEISNFDSVSLQNEQTGLKIQQKTNSTLTEKSNLSKVAEKNISYDVSSIVQVEIEVNSSDSTGRDDTSKNPSSKSNNSGDNRLNEENSTHTSDDTKFTCSLCPSSYVRKYDMQRHMKKSHNPQNQLNEQMLYKCIECMRTFTRKYSLKEHQKREHDYVVQRRGDSIDGISMDLILKAEREVNGKIVYHCDLCKKFIKTQRGYANHVRVHTGERPFTCHMCGMQYRTGHSLKRHLRCVHEGIKEHSCDICGRMFAEKGARDNHRRSHTGEKPYVCHVCGKAFPTANCIYLHRRIHSDYRPHQCTFCDKRFRKRQVLILHIRTHTGEKPYTCNVCGKSFKARNEMKRHMTVHSADKPYSCSLCGLCFGQTRYLKNHMKSHHGCSR